MKTYRVEKNCLSFIDKLIHQNKGTIVDCKEGCLLDSLLIYTKRGCMAIIETYLNSNASCYTLYFSTNEDDVYKEWDKIPYPEGE